MRARDGRRCGIRRMANWQPVLLRLDSRTGRPVGDKGFVSRLERGASPVFGRRFTKLHQELEKNGDWLLFSPTPGRSEGLFTRKKLPVPGFPGHEGEPVMPRTAEAPPICFPGFSPTAARMRDHCTRFSSRAQRNSLVSGLRSRLFGFSWARAGGLLFILSIQLGSLGCAFIITETYRQRHFESTDGVGIYVKNFPDGGSFWPSAERWYGRLIMLGLMKAPYSLAILFCDYEHKLEAVKLIEVEVRAADGSTTAPAQVKIPLSEDEWQKTEGWWIDPRLRIFTRFLVSGVDWSPPVDGQKHVILAIRFFVRTKTGDIEEHRAEIRLRRIVHPAVYPITL